MYDDELTKQALEQMRQTEAQAKQAKRAAHWDPPAGYHRCHNCGATVVDRQAECQSCGATQVWIEQSLPPIKAPRWAWVVTVLLVAVIIGAALVLVASFLPPY